MKRTTIADKLLAHLAKHGPTKVSPLLRAGGGGVSAMTSLGRLYRRGQVIRSGNHHTNLVYALPDQAITEATRTPPKAKPKPAAPQLPPPRAPMPLRTATAFCIPPSEAQLAALKNEPQGESVEEFVARGGKIQRLPTCAHSRNTNDDE